MVGGSVPGPRREEEMGALNGGSVDTSAGGNDSGSCLVSSSVNPGLGGGSPRGGRGSGSPLEGWGGLRNHCEDVCLESGGGVLGGGGGACGNLVDMSLHTVGAVPYPRHGEERRTPIGNDDDARVGGAGDGHNLTYFFL